MNATETLDTLKAAVKADPSDTTARLALADAYEEEGRMGDAEEQRALANLTVEDRKQALADYLNDGCGIHEPELIDDQGWWHTGFDVGNASYLVLTDDEADERVKERVLESVWAFSADFLAVYISQGDWKVNKRAIAKVQEACSEDCNDLLRSALADEDEFVREAVSADGRGHFLSSYDGEENEVRYKGTTFYIYRV